MSTCISCRVIFANGDVQRDHYKSDWHRYNLKRKVADLAPVAAETFQQKVLAYQAENAPSTRLKTGSNYCGCCRKKFSNLQAYDNHLQSNRHKELEAKEPDDSNSSIQKADEPTPDPQPTDIADDVDDGWEDASVDGDFLNEEGALVSTECLFCPVSSTDMQLNLGHMYSEHGFFVPDLNYCVDLEGLLVYLGKKVGAGRICLTCNERGKRFETLLSVQAHMRDKQHCNFQRDVGAMLEFEDFFDYSSSYPDATEHSAEDEVDVSDLVEDGWSLVLPSGNTLGHRSLVRYYRQRLKPEAQLIAAKKGRESVKNIIAQYKALGWTGETGAAAVQRARDIRFMKQIDAKKRLRIGLGQNGLARLRFRDANNSF